MSELPDAPKNETFWMVREYMKRRSLAKLGYTAPFETLTAKQAEDFYQISMAVAEVERARLTKTPTAANAPKRDRRKKR